MKKILFFMVIVLFQTLWIFPKIAGIEIFFRSTKWKMSLDRVLVTERIPDAKTIKDKYIKDKKKGYPAFDFAIKKQKVAGFNATIEYRFFNNQFYQGRYYFYTWENENMESLTLFAEKFPILKKIKKIMIAKYGKPSQNLRNSRQNGYMGDVEYVWHGNDVIVFIESLYEDLASRSINKGVLVVYTYKPVEELAKKYPKEKEQEDMKKFMKDF